MNRQKRLRSFSPLSQMTAALMSPLLQKKAGLNMRLVRHWAEIVGRDIADAAVPLKIIWPRQSRAADGLPKGGLGAAVLVISCFGYAALKLQHETGEIIARVNRFFGYPAIAKIRIEQKMPASLPAVNRAGAGFLGGFAAPPGADEAEQAALQWVKTPFGFAAAQHKRAPMADRLKADIAEIDDEALRASLLRLGKTLFKT